MLEIERLQEFINRHRRLFVLTGAGCSTNSGIPDYRDADGNWKRPQPVTYQAFMGGQATRQRYWARSLVGWRTGIAPVRWTPMTLLREVFVYAQDPSPVFT